MTLSEVKNSRLFRQIIQVVFDKKFEDRTYSLEHSSVRMQDYEPLIQIIRDEFPNWYGNFSPVKYTVAFHQEPLEIDIAFNDRNAGIAIDIKTGTIRAP